MKIINEAKSSIPYTYVKLAHEKPNFEAWKAEVDKTARVPSDWNRVIYTTIKREIEIHTEADGVFTPSKRFSLLLNTDEDGPALCSSNDSHLLSQLDYH